MNICRHLCVLFCCKDVVALRCSPTKLIERKAHDLNCKNADQVSTQNILKFRNQVCRKVNNQFPVNCKRPVKGNTRCMCVHINICVVLFIYMCLVLSSYSVQG